VFRGLRKEQRAFIEHHICKLCIFNYTEPVRGLYGLIPIANAALRCDAQHVYDYCDLSEAAGYLPQPRSSHVSPGVSLYLSVNSFT